MPKFHSILPMLSLSFYNIMISHHKYSCISSSLTAAGVSTPRSVKSSDMNSAWQRSDSILALQMQSMEHCVKQIKAGVHWQ